MVWARGRVGTEECPRSFVSAASVGFVEKYFARKMMDLGDVTAREAEAFAIVERELRMEQANGQR